MSIESWKVLVVEDEIDSMDLVQEILSHYHIENYAAYSAEDALGLMQQVMPNLAICDLALPQMNGWELLREIRSNPETADMPVIALTAFHSANVAQEAIRAGFNAYFSKPIEAVSFVQELERIVDSAGS